MDGRNSSGRTVSLLNDAAASVVAAVAAPQSHASSFHPASASSSTTKLPPLTTLAHQRHFHPFHSRPHSESPSEASTPSLSPQTPPLIRSSSSDSRAFGSPSPLTPQSSSFDGAPQFAAAAAAHKPSQSLYSYRPWSKMDDPTLYPPMADIANMGYSLPPMSGNPMAIPVPQMRSSDSPTSDSRISNVSASSAAAASASAKQGTKKSQYPCPLAKQFKCNDFFTTSGHAARHAKKHTGRKDAICPECNKAFTRKDNMEQHRRTHQNVRGPSKAAPDANRVKKPVKQGSRKDRNSISSSLESAVEQHINDQAHMSVPEPEHYSMMPGAHLGPAPVMASSGPYFMSAEPIAALPQPVNEYAVRPPLYRTGFTGLSTLDFNSAVTPSLTDPELHFTYPSPGLSNGLNTLALAASDQRRMSEEASSAKSMSTTP